MNNRALHTSCVRKGLEEFFDLPENWGELTVKSGNVTNLNVYCSVSISCWLSKNLRCSHLDSIFGASNTLTHTYK